MKDLQQAADDVGVIAETIDTLIKLLDKFHADHGEQLYERIEAAWPTAPELRSTKPLYQLHWQLTPPDCR